MDEHTDRRAADIASLAGFFDHRGIHTVVQGEFLWYAVRPGRYQCLPCHVEPDELASRVDDLFRRRRVVAGRFTTMRELTPAAPSPGVVYLSGGEFVVDELSSNTRSKVRRGQKKCSVGRVDAAELTESGIPLNVSTAARQGTAFGASEADDWRSFCRAASRTPLLDAWEVRVEGTLAALAMCFPLGDTYYISNVCSDANHLNAYPNNALLATILDDVLARPEIRRACYGMASLDPTTEGLHQFKTSMGFEARAVQDNVVSRFGGVLRAARPLVSRIATRTGSHRLQQLGGGLARVHAVRAVRRYGAGRAQPAAAHSLRERGSAHS